MTRPTGRLTFWQSQESIAADLTALEGLRRRFAVEVAGGGRYYSISLPRRITITVGDRLLALAARGGIKAGVRALPLVPEEDWCRHHELHPTLKATGE